MQQRDEERKQSFAVPLEDMIKGFNPDEIESLQDIISE